VLADVTIQPPAVPVVANVTGEPHGSPDAIRAAMLAQVTGAVHWYEGVDAMTAAGVTRFIECGPGKVLSGLIKRIARDAQLCNVQDTATLEAAVAAINA